MQWKINVGAVHFRIHPGEPDNNEYIVGKNVDVVDYDSTHLTLPGGEAFAYESTFGLPHGQHHDEYHLTIGRPLGEVFAVFPPVGPTMTITLSGTHVPEPDTLSLVGAALFLAMLGSRSLRRRLSATPLIERRKRC